MYVPTHCLLFCFLNDPIAQFVLCYVIPILFEPTKYGASSLLVRQMKYKYIDIHSKIYIQDVKLLIARVSKNTSYNVLFILCKNIEAKITFLFIS